MLLTYLRALMPSLHHRQGQHKTVLSRRWCEQNWWQVKTVFSNPRRISWLDKTVVKIFCRWQSVLTCRQFCSHRRHGQDKTVLSCPCRRCELGIGDYSQFCFTRQTVTVTITGETNIGRMDGQLSKPSLMLTILHKTAITYHTTMYIQKQPKEAP